MANKMIYDFSKILQEPETNEETQQKRALKQNFKALNKNFDATAIWRQLNLLYVAAMKIVGGAEGNEIDFDKSKGEGGFTFLHYAAWANAAGLVKTFLHHEGVDVNAQSDAGLTALQLAIIQNSPKILKILLSHSETDLNLACLDGWTSLHLAISYGHEELIAEIVKFKSKLQIDARMRHQITPLQLAALLDKGNLVKILLENGAAAQLTTDTGETALKLAGRFKCQNSVEILRMHAAAKILLESAASKAATSQVAAVTDQMSIIALENQSTNTETGTSQNFTPNVTKPPTKIYDFSADGVNDAATLQLFCTTFGGKVDEMKSLLAQHEIDLKAFHKTGKNIWDFAILNGDPAVVECLLEAKNQEANLTDLLFKAAKMGSLAIVKHLIEVKNLKTQLKNKQSQPLLIAATLSGSLELLRYLIEVQCIDIRESFENEVVFDYAAIEENLKLMLYLVKEKDLKFDASFAGTILSILFKFVRIGSLEDINNFIEMGKLELKHKKGAENGTILHEAAWNKNLDVIKYFIEEHDLSITDRDDKGFVPLFCSVESNNLAAVIYFMEEHKLSIYFEDKKNRTALHIAALNGHLEIVRYLVEVKKFSVNAKDNDGATPLILSFKSIGKTIANSGHVNVMKYLWKMISGSLNLDQLVEYVCVAIYGKNSAVDKARLLLDAAREGNLTLIKFLIEEVGFDANMKGEKNRTALHIAAVNGHLEIAWYLVEEKKANVNAKDDDGSTPLLLSAQNGNLEVFWFLWKLNKETLGTDQLLAVIIAAAGGKNDDIINLIIKEIEMKKSKKYLAAERQEIKDFLLNWSNNNSMAKKKQILFDAAHKGNLTLIKFLIEDLGMDANVKNNWGSTPIFLAVDGNELEAVKYFVECANVDLDARNIYYLTVRAYAWNNGLYTIASYLTSVGAPL